MGYETASSRWSGIGPYYAMFPLNFVDEVINTYTERGQFILDPFAGRASSIFSGAVQGRPGVGIEINPVGWIYGKTKLSPGTADEVKKRLSEINNLAKAFKSNDIDELPDFFSLCFSNSILQFLITAKNNLNWQDDKIDRTLMTLILIDLHGGVGKSLSNQMRQSRAMSPEYSINWWNARNMKPPEIDPQLFLEKKIKWRYDKGLPLIVESKVILGDSTDLLKQFQKQSPLQNWKPFSLLFTSPPYMGISDYHRDQWLRLWMLGQKPYPSRNQDKHRGRFHSIEFYKDLLNCVFMSAAELMDKNGFVYVRTDAREQTFEITRNALKSAFPKWNELILDKPYSKQTQTALYGDKSQKPGEKDIILTRRRHL